MLEDDPRRMGWMNPPAAQVERAMRAPWSTTPPRRPRCWRPADAPELYARLSEHVVGQEEAKRALSVAVYNHYKRISMGAAAQEGRRGAGQVEHHAHLAPTGSGKTLAGPNAGPR